MKEEGHGQMELLFCSGFLLGFDETTTTQCIREHPQRIISNVGKCFSANAEEYPLIKPLFKLRLIISTDSRKYGKTWVTFTPKDPSAFEPITA